MTSEAVPSAKSGAENVEWKCSSCGQVNLPDATHCRHCEYSRKITWAGVLHDRGCNPMRCTCGAKP